MQNQEIKKDLPTAKEIKKINPKDMKQIKGGFVIIDDIIDM